MRLRVLALLAVALAGCGGPGGCRPAAAVVENASATPIEQFYMAPDGTADWGADLLSADLPSGASLPFRFAGAGRTVLRVVWADGRAMELPGVDGCAIRRVTVSDAGMQAR